MTSRDTRLIFAGHGGQGVLSMAEVLGNAATVAGRFSCCHMIFGAEMRGGIVRCYVTVSDSELSELVIEEPHGVVCMNQEAWDNVAGLAAPNGFAVANTSLIADPVHPDSEVEVIPVPCNRLAEEVGSTRVVAMVALGAVIEKTGVVSTDLIEQALQRVLPERHHKLIPVNLAALEAGREAARTTAVLAG